MSELDFWSFATFTWVAAFKVLRLPRVKHRHLGPSDSEHRFSDRRIHPRAELKPSWCSDSAWKANTWAHCAALTGHHAGFMPFARLPNTSWLYQSAQMVSLCIFCVTFCFLAWCVFPPTVTKNGDGWLFTSLLPSLCFISLTGIWNRTAALPGFPPAPPHFSSLSQKKATLSRPASRKLSSTAGCTSLTRALIFGCRKQRIVPEWESPHSVSSVVLLGHFGSW